MMVVSRCIGSALRLICFPVGAALLVTLGGCRSGVPVLDTSPKPTEADGTISGVVRGPKGTSAIEGREVAVINVDTGERQRVVTNNAGGFSFKLKPGKYRVEVALLHGEAIVKKPGVIDLNRSDVDAHADFVIGATRLRYPPRVDDGLGSPIA